MAASSLGADGAGAPLLLSLAVLACRAAAQGQLRVAYVGAGTGFIEGWRAARDRLTGGGGLPVNGGAQRFNLTAMEYFLDDSASSNPHVDRDVVLAVSSAAAADVDVIVVGSSRINQRVMDLAEAHSIPNVHCSGGHPALWQSSQPHSFGMHVPFTWYSKGAISAGKVGGLKTLSVLRSFQWQWQFPRISGLASLEWARESGYTVIGPTVQWCRTYAHLTGSCRVLGAPSGGQRCVCGQQSEADSLGYSNLRLDELPGMYEMQDDLIKEADFGVLTESAEVSMNLTRFTEGIIDDIRSQGGDPDVLACWVAGHRSVVHAAHRRSFNPKMWVGVPSKADATWFGVEATLHGGTGAQVLGATHAAYFVSGMQWSKTLRLADPVFNTNTEFVAQFERLHGRAPSYDEAACAAAGSVIHLALNKYTPSLDPASVAQRRESLRLGIGDVNDDTIYGMTRFNRGGQNNGRGAVTVQFFPEGAGVGTQRVVLPGDLAERALQVPLPTWDSRFGCAAGRFNTGDRCDPCGPGRFNPATTAGLNATACSLCSPGSGTGPSEQGTTQCRQCAPGYVQDGNLHQGVCRGCGPGTYRSAAMPSTTCELCSAGTFSNATGADACDPCPGGTHQPDVGQTQCVCNRAWYRNPAVTRAQPCLACEQVLPGATTRQSGSVSRQDCTCDRGFFLLAGACRSCADEFPEDSVECAGFGAPPVLRRGWMTPAGRSTVYLCPSRGDGCPGGVPVGMDRCAEGGSGIACARCGDGFRYSMASGRCLECGPGGGVLYAILALLALGLALVLRPPTTEYSKTSLFVALRNSFVTLTLSQILDVLQLYAILAGTALQFSGAEGRVLSGAGGLFSFDTLSPQCDIGGGPSDHALRTVALANSMPAFLIAWLGFCSLPGLVSRRCRELRFPSTISSSNMCLGMFVSFFTTVLNLSINMVFTTYAHPKTGESSLLAFPYLTDASPQMAGLHAIAGIALALWCVGTLVIVAALCWYLRTDKPSTLMRRCTLALVVRHRDGMSWWMVVEMTQKLLTSIAPAIFKRPDVQMQWMVLVFLLYAILLALVKPYRFLRHTGFDVLFTFAKIMMLVLVATSLYNRAPSDSGVLAVMIFTFVLSALSALWCIQTLASGSAADVRHDAELLKKLQAALGLDVEPVNIGDVLPYEEDLPDHLRSSRRSRASRCTARSGVYAVDSETGHGAGQKPAPAWEGTDSGRAACGTRPQAPKPAGAAEHAASGEEPSRSAARAGSGRPTLPPPGEPPLGGRQPPGPQPWHHPHGAPPPLPPMPTHWTDRVASPTGVKKLWKSLRTGSARA